MTTFATLVDVLGSSWTQHVHKLCTLDQNAHLPAFYGSQAQPPLLGSMDSDWCCRAPHSSPLTDEFITMLWIFFGRRPLPFGGSPLEAYPWTSGESNHHRQSVRVKFITMLWRRIRTAVHPWQINLSTSSPSRRRS